MSTIDPITLSVLAGRMEQIADEMDATLFRAAFSITACTANDITPTKIGNPDLPCTNVPPVCA